jgi:hypothetical protein
LADTVTEEGTPLTQPPRLSFDDALLLWRAREVHRVQAFFVGLVLLVFLGEVFVFCLVGRWYVGLLLVGVQWMLLRCLLWGLRWGLWWTGWGLAWCRERATRRLGAWWQAQTPLPRKGPYADDHR